MTVEQLILELQALPKDATVLLTDDESGLPYNVEEVSSGYEGPRGGFHPIGAPGRRPVVILR
jgi:hypothetical protein